MPGNHSSSLPFSRSLLFFWSLITLVAAFVLVCSGGLVTSKDAGLSVPDWPNTYGYNMFLFPISKWVGGVFYEHSHRLIASAVGLFSLILSVWLFISESRRWVKIIGLIAFIAVCIQGVLGGLRVVLHIDHLGIPHAQLAQSVLCLFAVLTLALSPVFVSNRWDVFCPDRVLRRLVLVTTLLVFVQLTIGATMRHEHAGLAISDFPLAYGKILPDTSPAAIAAINAKRISDNQPPVKPVQIWLQMEHRLLAVVILGLAFMVLIRAISTSQQAPVRLWSTTWLALMALQAGLGAWTIWSNKAADVATAHMAVGAIILLLGVLFTFRLFRGAQPARFTCPDPSLPRNRHDHLA